MFHNTISDAWPFAVANAITSPVTLVGIVEIKNNSHSKDAFQTFAFVLLSCQNCMRGRHRLSELNNISHQIQLQFFVQFRKDVINMIVWCTIMVGGEANSSFRKYLTIVRFEW